MTDEQKRLRRLYRWAVVKWARRSAICLYWGVFAACMLLWAERAFSAIPNNFIAEVAAPAIPSLDGLASVTSLGFAVWYGWYTTTKVIPRIIEQHDKQIDKLTTAFREECREMREKFLCKHGGQ